MLSRSLIEDILNQALALGGDYAEIFVEDNFTTEIATLGGQLQRGMSGRDFGVGIRIFKGLSSVYGYTNDSSRESLLALTKKIAQPLGGSGDMEPAYLKEVRPHIHPFKVAPSKLELEKKLAYTKRAFRAAMDYDELISQVRVNHLDQDQRVLIANSLGELAEDRRVKTRMLINVAAQQGSLIETGYIGPGAMKGLEFYDEISIEDYAREAARNAKTMVLADYCPSGNMPVVIDQGFGGLMFHEACGSKATLRPEEPWQPWTSLVHQLRLPN